MKFPAGLLLLMLAACTSGEWVRDYYATIKSEECKPLGWTVNPNIAAVSGFSVHQDQTRSGAKFIRIITWKVRDAAPPWPRVCSCCLRHPILGAKGEPK